MAGRGRGGEGGGELGGGRERGMGMERWWRGGVGGREVEGWRGRGGAERVKGWRTPGFEELNKLKQLK